MQYNSGLRPRRQPQRLMQSRRTTLPDKSHPRHIKPRVTDLTPNDINEKYGKPNFIEKPQFDQSKFPTFEFKY